MEYEIDDDPQGGEYSDQDSHLIDDHPALRTQSSVKPSDYPDRKDRALHIPDQEGSDRAN